MAFDTLSQRFSLLNIGTPWQIPLPEPDGTFNYADRLQLLSRFAFTGAPIQPVRLIEVDLVLTDLIEINLELDPLIELDLRHDALIELTLQ